MKPFEEIVDEILTITNRQTDSRIVHSALKLYVRELLDDAAINPTIIDVYESVNGGFYASRAEALMAAPDRAQLNPKTCKALAVSENKIWPLVGTEPTTLYRDGNSLARERALAKLTPEERKLLKLED